MDLSYKNLEKAIKKLGRSVVFQKESGQLLMIFKESDIEYPVFIRLVQHDTLIQFVMFFPCKVEEPTLLDTLMLLNFYNRQIDLPGFCYDEVSNLIFYRAVLHAFDKKMISTFTLENILTILESIANTFAPLTHLVCSGNKSYNDIKSNFDKVSGRK